LVRSVVFEVKPAMARVRAMLSSPRILAAIALATAVCSPRPTFADPIHAIAQGAYWHHDSGWIFPERIGEFVRVGIPQDVAGSRDAVAYYAREANGVRMVASVDVVAADSTAEGATQELAETALGAKLASELPLNAKGMKALHAVHGRRALYFAVVGEWRVRILVELPAGGADTAQLDDFVRGQRWGTLLRAGLPQL
jgi:hypothetical protein